MDWQHITRTDPYLAGRLAARAWDWWTETTAEQEADRVGLTGEGRADFLRAWQEELTEREQERIKERAKERDAMLDAAEGKGDPAAQ